MRHALDREHVDVGGQRVVERVPQTIGWERRLHLEVRDLEQGVNPGVGPPRPVQLEPLPPTGALHGPVQLSLDGAGILLDLPAAVPRAHVLERQLEAQRSVLELLGEVVLDPDLLDLLELSLEPVDVLLFVLQDFLEEQARAVVPLAA